MLFGLTQPSFAESSGYYEASDGRPRAAFSKCCCSEDSKDDKQVTYFCEFHEGEICPFNTKPYKTSAFDCPSSLSVSRYLPGI
ncbi:MAG: hypothetical protein A3B68_02490 [Candidatus Melainabacteria bacterium RIFCSPHIGHO2_02_FULL_34_12]|nr:MAG: hypothetical protein A3B68_02490 [Candidatus Melainabacteria bacterium RIFCSPHIGHO2_02_FULL_34_12]